VYIGLTLAESAVIGGATLEGDPDRTIGFAAPIEYATSSDLTLFENRADPALVDKTQSEAVVVPLSFATSRHNLNLLRSATPKRCFLEIVHALWERRRRPLPAVSSSASIHPSARICDGVYIGEACVIGPNVEISNGAVLHPGVVVEAGARVGSRTVLHARVFVGAGVRVADNCVIQTGAVIGFSYCSSIATGSVSVSDKAESFGGVVIEEGVEIGPNTLIESGEEQPTRICTGAKIGGLVSVGHDCCIGPGAELISMVGLAGGVQVGAEALLLGQVGVTSRARIGERAVIFAKSGVSSDVPSNALFSGYPARPRREWLRSVAAGNLAPKLRKQFTELQRTVGALVARLEKEP
jgi:UDP-3-O-[3-hydroxymyristoyl] glucosamine N-acyltransferase